MACTEPATRKARRPAEESELIMAAARLKLKAARVLSTRRIAAAANEAEAQAIDDLAAEMAAQIEVLPADRRAALLSRLTA